MALTQEQLDGHVNQLRGVIRLAKRSGGEAYGHLIQAVGVAFQAVAPDNADVKALARRLNKEADSFNVDSPDNAQKENRAGQAQGNTGRPQPTPQPDRASGQQQSK